MSTAEIDPLTYRSILTSIIAHLIGRGYPRRDAVRIAHRQMRSAFTCLDDNIQTEFQRDTDDEQSSDWTR